MANTAAKQRATAGAIIARAVRIVTICSHDKKHIFGEVENDEVQLLPIGRIADTELRTLGSHYANVSVDSHIVMPNHVHAIIVIDGNHQFAPNPVALSPLRGTSPAAGFLGAIVGSYKAGVTWRCHELGFPRETWQPRFYDRIIRGDANISAVREYIFNNPANWSHGPDFL